MNRVQRGVILAASLSLALAAMAHADQAALNAIKSYDFGQSRESIMAMQDMVQDAEKDPAAAAALAAQLAELLGEPGVTYACKQFVCQQLWIIGGTKQVPALAALLDDAKTANDARYALERMDLPEAEKALLDALKTAPKDALPGIVNSLGEKRSAKAVRPLAKLAKGDDPVLRLCALNALGKIGNKKAASELRSMRRRLQEWDPAKPPVLDAEVTCAIAMAHDGDTKTAAKILKSVIDVLEGGAIRSRAQIALNGLPHRM